MKYLDIIEGDKERDIIKEIAKIDFDSSMTEIQINNFVLNDIEFPTEYGKFLQAKLELSSRFGQLTELYYDIKEQEIEIKKLSHKIAEEDEFFDAQLLRIQRERSEIRLASMKKKVKTLLKEIAIFYRYYNNPEFKDLTDEEAYKLEANQWARKTINMPTLFEERYGEEYMKKAIGEEEYNRYKEIRKAKLGILPREMFLKQLEESYE